jgi:hypothetical protein
MPSRQVDVGLRDILHHIELAANFSAGNQAGPARIASLEMTTRRALAHTFNRHAWT